eukprot:s153_g24.t1
MCHLFNLECVIQAIAEEVLWLLLQIKLETTGTVAIGDYSLATTLGELMPGARASGTDTSTVERIEVQLGPPRDHLLTTQEQNHIGGAIMQIYEGRLMAKVGQLTPKEAREESEYAMNGIFNFMHSFNAADLLAMSSYAQLHCDEPAQAMS